LRKADKTLNQPCHQLNVAQAPDNTFIGKFERKLDFLGYRFGLPAFALAEQTITNAVNKVSALYEQKQTASKITVALDDRITQWLRE
jgi:hypothetical protein